MRCFTCSALEEVLPSRHVNLTFDIGAPQSDQEKVVGGSAGRMLGKASVVCFLVLVVVPISSGNIIPLTKLKDPLARWALFETSFGTACVGIFAGNALAWSQPCG